MLFRSPGVATATSGFLSPSTTASGWALTYRLPEFVGSGDVSIFEPGTGLVDDGLRFFNDNVSGLMQYFSDPGDSALADTGLPRDFNFGFGIDEVGSDGKNGFRYVAGSGDPAFTNFYNGISDVPEPGTVALIIGAGVSGVSLLARKRRK